MPFSLKLAAIQHSPNGGCTLLIIFFEATALGEIKATFISSIFFIKINIKLRLIKSKYILNTNVVQNKLELCSIIEHIFN